jgi:hypothetical protein
VDVGQESWNIRISSTNKLCSILEDAGIVRSYTNSPASD